MRSPARSIVVCLVSALALAGAAVASEPMSDRDVARVALGVNGRGEALVTYKRSDGRVRRVLVWGAIGSRHPSTNVPQVRFRYDYAGGWGKYGRLYWRGFRNRCRAYDGPPLQYLVAACKAPDGSYWALQRWQRRLPLLGFAPWRADQAAWELHVSHWTGPIGRLEVSPNWTYGGAFEGVFGRLTYLGLPVHGFSTTAEGNPRDRYGRNVYIDTFNSPYGRGWHRESAIVAHRPTGTFCHSFVPQRPAAGYPSRDVRPAGRGERYRVTVMGPGVTPVIEWEGAGLGSYDARRDGEINRLFDALMAGDGICRGER